MSANCNEILIALLVLISQDFNGFVCIVSKDMQHH